MREISIEEFPPETPRRSPDECGPAPQQMWLPIVQLRVDPRYQREITKQGKGNIRRIAAGFHWKYFSPVIVAPVAGGLYAIVDGQHRSTAAALCGHAAVPCHVIFADVSEQAQAFSAINGAVTRVHSLAMHRAAVAAGDKAALAIEDATSAAGVQVLRYPLPELKQLPGQTMAIGALRDCLQEFGHDAVVLGLKGVTQTGNAVQGGAPGPDRAGARHCGAALADPRPRARRLRRGDRRRRADPRARQGDPQRAAEGPERGRCPGRAPAHQAQPQQRQLGSAA